jgi:flagellar hook-length control protein FliK
VRFHPLRLSHAQPYLSRFQVGTRTDGLSVQSSLFEQILSLPVTPSRIDPASDAPATDNSHRDNSEDLASANATSSDEEKSAEEDSADLQASGAQPAVPVTMEPPTDAEAVPDGQLNAIPEPTVAETETATSPHAVDEGELAQAEIEPAPVASEATNVGPRGIADHKMLSATPAEEAVSGGETNAPHQQSQQLSAPPTDEPQVDAQASTVSDRQQATAETGQTEIPTSSRQAENRERNNRQEKWYAKDPESTGPKANAVNPNDKRFATSASQETQATPNLGAAELTTAARSPTPDPATNATTDVVALPTDAIPTTATNAASSVLVPKSTVAATANANATETGIGSTSTVTSTSATKVQAEAPRPVTREQSVDLSQQDRVRLVQRISRSFSRLGPMGGLVNIKLHPPQLGSLNVQVQLEGRNMTAKLSTESAAARDAILESLPVLRGRLAEQGFEISQFQVEVADNNTDAAMGGNQQQNTSEQFGDRQEQANVDYRRLATGDRQSPAVDREFPPEPSLLAWQTMTGIDLQA